MILAFHSKGGNRQETKRRTQDAGSRSSGNFERFAQGANRHKTLGSGRETRNPGQMTARPLRNLLTALALTSALAGCGGNSGTGTTGNTSCEVGTMVSSRLREGESIRLCRNGFKATQIGMITDPFSGNVVCLGAKIEITGLGSEFTEPSSPVTLCPNSNTRIEVNVPYDPSERIDRINYELGVDEPTAGDGYRIVLSATVSDVSYRSPPH